MARALPCALVALVAFAPVAEAKERKVEPGKGTLERAVDRAEPGDELVLERKGVYKTRGSTGVVVEKRLTITGRGRGRNLPRVDGRCRVDFTMLILSGPVTLENFKVTGASDERGGQYGGADVNFIGGGNGTARGLKLRDTCGVNYGINVFGTGDVLVDENQGRGYDDAAVYVGGIRDPADVVQITGNVVRRNNRGILIEHSAGNGGILVSGNAANSNGNGFTPAGIFLHNSDGVVIADNVANENPYAGIHLDVTSDDNRVLDNRASGNAGGAQGGIGADLLNEGARNCGSGNAFGTTAGNPLPAC